MINKCMIASDECKCTKLKTAYINTLEIIMYHTFNNYVLILDIDFPRNTLKVCTVYLQRKNKLNIV